MQSPLDGKKWFLDAVVFREGLHVLLIEGKVGEPSDIEVAGRLLSGTRPIEVDETSTTLRIVFSRVVAWQVVDESYTAWDDYEEIDDKSPLQILNKSRYMDYINENHGWYKDTVGPAQHYRVWTYDAVIDVMAHDPPAVRKD